MKPECGYTRKQLPRYLGGRLFKLQRTRVERHLAECPVCSSEFDALRRIRETKHFLRDLESGKDIGGTARSLGSAVVRLMYRPLWVLLIVVAVTVLYRNVLMPVLHDPDIEKLDPGALPEPPAAALQSASSATTPAASAPQPESRRESPRAVDPLVVVITLDKDREKEGMKRINEAMKEHAGLRSLRFSDTVREVAGNLTTDELQMFFNSIKNAAKVNYKRSRLASEASGALVPVALRLRTKQMTQPGERPADKPAENAGGTMLNSPEEQRTAPSQPAQ